MSARMLAPCPSSPNCVSTLGTGYGSGSQPPFVARGGYRQSKETRVEFFLLGNGGSS